MSALQQATPAQQTLLHFFDYLFGKQNGYVCVATASPDKTNFKQQFFVWPDQKLVLVRYVEGEGKRKNVWFCVNLLNQAERRKEYCLPSAFAWADLDYVIPSRNGNDPDSVPYPTCIVESSPARFQAYWKIEGDPVPSDVAEEFSRKIAYKLGADKSGWDLTQLLRVPWTNNFKYDPPVPVKILDIGSAAYDISLFDKIPGPIAEDDISVAELPDDLPTSQTVLYKFKSEGRLDEEFTRMFVTEPEANADWSRILWRFIHKSFEIGMTAEEVFVVASEAACNKYNRDNRPKSYLWRDVSKAAQEQKNFELLLSSKVGIVTMPHLVDFDEFEEGAFIKDYKTWANQATDAPEQYHELSCFIALSAIVSSGLWLSVHWGEVVPNIWGLVLGESTLSRKAQPLTSKILTPTGWKLMGDIAIGDEVISQDGKPTKVIGISPRTIEKVVRVKFGDGSSTECTLDHLWTFKGQGSKSQYKTWPLSKILAGGFRYGSSTQWIRHIPIVDPIEFDYQPKPLIEPYTLGLLLGDGGMSQDSIRFTNHLGDSELVARLMEGLKPLDMRISKAVAVGETVDYRIVTASTEHRGFSRGRVNKLIDALKELGLMGKLSNQKFIPDQYKYGTIETRLAILQGLMDTDGWVSKNSAVFCSSSLQLALDVRDIVWSLGGWSSLTQDKLDSWNVRVNLGHGMNPFRLKRKHDKVKRIFPRTRTMRDIEHAGEKEVQCIKVDNPSGLYVTDNFIVTHNTTAMRLAVDMLTDLDDSLILASDASAEGLLTGLSLRPERVSIFYKDEVSGFFDSINRKDYLAGMPETLAQLYDVPTILPRRLRKEVITVCKPYFIFFGGGIRDKVYSLVSEEYILSGFLPRFLIVSGENDLSRLRRTGPPTIISTERRDNLVTSLADMRDRFTLFEKSSIAGQQIDQPVRIEAKLTDEAWVFQNELEDKLVNAGMESDLSMLALPTFQRLSFSLLKMSMLVAASRREPDANNQLMVELKDIKQAAFYVERWGHYSIDLLLNAGRSNVEKIISRALTLIRKKEGLPKSELMQRMHLTARDAKDLIDTMIQRGLIESRPAGRGVRLYSQEYISSGQA